jgi:hypothetical protein
VALLNRRNRADQETDRRFRELSLQVREMQSRLERCEAVIRTRRDEGQGAEPFAMPGTWSSRPAALLGKRGSGRAGGPAGDHFAEPKLIAVPNLSAGFDRQATHSGLSHRHAAIWDLADSGASAEVIARATGQPIGQIELILGLRRQLDGGRTSIPHASHE